MRRMVYQSRELGKDFRYFRYTFPNVETSRAPQPDMSLYEDPGRNHSENNREDFPNLPSIMRSSHPPEPPLKASFG